MNRKIIKWLTIVLLPGVIFACTGSKSIAQQDTQPEVIVEEKELRIDEQKKMEFEYLFVEALKEKALGNPQKAIQYLSGSLEINPNSSAAMYELATIHAENNDFTSAKLLLEKAISLNSENKWYQMLLAQIYQQTRQPGQAAEIYEKLLQKDPENMELLYMTAMLNAGVGNVEKALSTFNILENKVGINEQISVQKQQLYILDGQVDKAFEEIQKLIDSNPEEPRYYGLMADLYQSQGDSENAMKYYRKIQEIDPDNGFVHFSLANFYFQAGDLDKSFEETKLGFRSSDVDIQAKLQMYLMLTSNPAQSGIDVSQEEELIDILMEVHPQEHLLHTVRAESFLKKGNLEEARDELLKAISNEPNDYIIWERVLFIDNDLQDWENLHKHSSQAIELFPNQPQVYFLNAIASLQLEKYEETMAIADEGLMYVVDNKRMEGQFLMLKGEALYKKGKLQEAFSLFDESVELDPENHIALNNYAYYLTLAEENLDKAERMSGRVIEKFPDNSTYLDTYAWVLFKKGEYRLARFYMESAIKNGGEDNSTLLEHYGDILYKLNRVEEAVKYWERAKNLGEYSELLEKKINERSYID